MNQPTASILENSGNFAIVQMPGRRFPAHVLPGDSFHILFTDVVDLVEALQSELGAEHEQVENARSILESLRERHDYYESVVAKSGGTLPY
jgi:hypothetical protein